MTYDPAAPQSYQCFRNEHPHCRADGCQCECHAPGSDLRSGGAPVVVELREDEAGWIRQHPTRCRCGHLEVFHDIEQAFCLVGECECDYYETGPTSTGRRP